MNREQLFARYLGKGPKSKQANKTAKPKETVPTKMSRADSLAKARAAAAEKRKAEKAEK